jgi:hypothetical protein
MLDFQTFPLFLAAALLVALTPGLLAEWSRSI